MSIKVINPGALTTVQDRGRTGFQSRGVRVCGVMDAEAYDDAVRIAGGQPGDAVLEMTLFGGSYRFEEAACFALAGADMKPTLAGKACPMYAKVFAKAGDVLDLGFAASGCRTYLAFEGGIDVPQVMNSRSTDIKCRIGGFEGRALRSGDVLPIGRSRERCSSPDIQEKGSVRVYPETVEVRAVPGPQDDRFTAGGLKTFFGSSYRISEDSDRMGYRLTGPVIESISGTDIISDGIVFGSVQVSADGLPIILMADRQTTGGYAKIATVISADLPRLAQCRPGCTVRFIRTEIEELK